MVLGGQSREVIMLTDDNDHLPQPAASGHNESLGRRRNTALGRVQTDQEPAVRLRGVPPRLSAGTERKAVTMKQFAQQILLASEVNYNQYLICIIGVCRARF